MATDLVFFKIFISFWCNMSCLLKIGKNSQEASANSLFSGFYFKTMHYLTSALLSLEKRAHPTAS
jgi:hypothetical protein